MEKGIKHFQFPIFHIFDDNLWMKILAVHVRRRW